MDGSPLTIAVASTNPVKARAITNAFARHFPERDVAVEAISAASGVSSQPKSDAETKQGAVNRLQSIRTAVPNADVWAALEGGIEDSGRGGMQAFAWILVATTEVQGAARTATFPLPEVIAEHIRAGRELGEADDLIFARSNSKQHEGAIGILTQGLVDRCQLYEHAALMAMIPLVRTDLFRGNLD